MSIDSNGFTQPVTAVLATALGQAAAGYVLTVAHVRPL